MKTALIALLLICSSAQADAPKPEGSYYCVGDKLIIKFKAPRAATFVFEIPANPCPGQTV